MYPDLSLQREITGHVYASRIEVGRSLGVVWISVALREAILIENITIASMPKIAYTTYLCMYGDPDEIRTRDFQDENLTS